jgi:hypothetical protein
MNEEGGPQTSRRRRKNPVRILFGWYWEYLEWWWERATKPSLLIPQLIIVLSLVLFVWFVSRVDDVDTALTVTLGFVGLMIGVIFGTVFAVIVRATVGIVMIIKNWSILEAKLWSPKWLLGGAIFGGIVGLIIGVTTGLLNTGVSTLPSG